MKTTGGHDIELLDDQGMVGGEEVGAEMMAKMEGMVEMDTQEMQEIMELEMMMEEMMMGEMFEQ